MERTCENCVYCYRDIPDANGEYPGPDWAYCHWEPKAPNDMSPCEEEDYWASAQYEN